LDDLTEHFCYSREKRRIAIFFRDKIAFLLKPMGCLEFHQGTNPSFPKFSPAVLQGHRTGNLLYWWVLFRFSPGKAPSRHKRPDSCQDTAVHVRSSGRSGRTIPRRGTSHSTSLGSWRFQPRPHAYGCFPYRKDHETSRSSKSRISAKRAEIARESCFCTTIARTMMLGHPGRFFRTASVQPS
jgi:hypothetical protein